MHKTLLFILLLAALVLAACQSATPTPAQTSAVEAAPVAQAATLTELSKGTSTPEQSGETAPTGSVPASEDSPGCVVQSPFPTPGPTEQSLYPPPGERDWIKGPDSATVTFTEYSDFQ